MSFSNRVLSYLQLMRFPAVFTAISNVVSAYLIAYQDASVEWLSLANIVFISSALYFSGMVLNDCFDLKEDRLERPQRPLPSAKIQIATAWKMGWGLMAMGVLWAYFVGQTTLTCALLLALFIIIYDGAAKQSIMAPLVMGGCRYINWLLGFSFISLQTEHFLIPAPVFFYICSLTFLSTEETSAEKRQSTFLLYLGAMSISLLSLFFLLINASLYLSLLIFSVFAIALGKISWKTYTHYSPVNIQKAVKSLLLGVIPLDAILVFSQTGDWRFVWVILLLIPGRYFSRYLRVT